MLINSYDLDASKLNKNDYELLKKFHSSNIIKLSNKILIISIAVEDFARLFNKNNTKIINLKPNQIQYNNELNLVIDKIYYNTELILKKNKIYSNININQLFEIIQNNNRVISYIFLDNFFIVSVKSHTNNNILLNLYCNSITNGYCPKFIFNYGFFDPNRNIYFDYIIKKLNKCYNDYLTRDNLNNKVLGQLVYK